MTGEDAEWLSEDDARILGLESDAITGHTLKLMLLEPGEPLDLDRLRSDVAGRLAGRPRATQRVVDGSDGPRWAHDPTFDISAHVRRRATSGAVTLTELWHSVGELMAEHLDHNRPLWTFDVLGPLADGREAIAARIHHAMADGIAGVKFLDSVLFDPHPDPPQRVGTAAAGSAPSRLTEAQRTPSKCPRGHGCGQQAQTTSCGGLWKPAGCTPPAWAQMSTVSWLWRPVNLGFPFRWARRTSKRETSSSAGERWICSP